GCKRGRKEHSSNYVRTVLRVYRLFCIFSIVTLKAANPAAFFVGKKQSESLKESFILEAERS
ncbi:hypothetical protein R0J91_14915, partial [Micrococcus sp. SIMBA_131]